MLALKRCPCQTRAMRQLTRRLPITGPRRQAAQQRATCRRSHRCRAPDNRAAQTSGSTESNLQTFAPMPRIAPGFSTPVDDFAERGVQEGLTPPVSPKTSMSAVSATPELDTQVAGPARKVEPTSSPSTIGLLDERQQPGTPPMIQTGLQSRFHGVGIDVQTLIAIALTLAAGWWWWWVW